MNQQIAEWLDAMAKILLRCWIFGFVLLLAWFGFFMLAPNVTVTSRLPTGSRSLQRGNWFLSP